MKTYLIATSAVALVASMSIALAQGQKGEGTQREMSQPPAVKEGSAEKNTPKAGERAEKNTPEAGERRDAPADKQAQQGKAKDASKDAAKGERQEPADRDRASKDTPRDGKKQAADKDRSKQAGKDKGGKDRVANLTQEQRTKVKSSFARHRGESTNVNISVSVGVAVPRSVQLYAVPEDIVVIVPQYRRYRYFVVDDRICIVDPDTYEIVEIIILV
jgi:hypothetical protein